MPPWKSEAEAPSAQSSESVSDTITEYMERERRKCDLIVYNFPEASTDLNFTERMKKDIEFFKQIIE